MMLEAKLGFFLFVCFVQGFAVQAAKDGLCPKAASVGACIVSCGQDEDCDGDKKCCNNGCGATCLPAVCPSGESKAKCPAQLCNYVGCPGVSSKETMCKIDFCGGCKVTFHNKTTGAKLDCGDEETLCKRILAKIQSKPMLGQYKPKCDEKGQYERSQCHEAFCFCVDPKTGVPDMSTRVHVPKRPDCGSASVCEQKQMEAKKLPLIGRFVPACKSDGSFNETQCHSSTGQCWCVDSNGYEWQGSRMQAPKRPNCLKSVCATEVKMLQCDPVICHAATCPGNPKALCRVNPCGKCSAEFLDEYGRTLQCLSKCQKQRQEALVGSSSGSGHPLVGRYIPQCTDDGRFQQVQCYGSTGYCWCVNDQGMALQATMTRGMPDCNKTDVTACPAGESPFVCLRNLCKWATCAANPQAQCKVNPCKACKVEFYDKDGNLTDCTKGQTSCQLERAKALAQSKNGRGLVGVFVPRCTANGSYERVQCWASTGYCWCVNDTGNEERETRQRGRPDCSLSSPTGAPAKKVGFCPPVTVASASCSNSCRSDAECKGNTKCCKSECGGTKCQSPLLTGCSNGKPYLLCLHLCQLARCPAFPNATCTADPCNMCKVEFLDQNHNPVNCSQGLTPCQFERQKSLGILGRFQPQCAVDGSYKPEQCHENYCWCVDKVGREINNTRGRGKPSCSSNGEQKALTPCQQQRSAALRRSGGIGAFVPQCTQSGEFNQTQCHASTGYCWCVDKTGTELARTRIRFRRPDCSRKACRPVGCNLFCYHGYQKNKDGCDMCKCNPIPAKPGFCPVAMGHGVCVESCSLDADCDGNRKCCSNGCGHTCQAPVFQGSRPGFCPAVSHSGSLGLCLSKCSIDDDCADPNQKCCSNGCGHFCTSPVRAACPGGVPLLRCFMDPCQRVSCPAYPKARCRTNYCGKCAAEFYDEDNKKVNCTKGLTLCQSEYVKKTAVLLLGAFIPRCSHDGSYAPKQCSASTGFCWCVNPLGKITSEKVRGDLKCNKTNLSPVGPTCANGKVYKLCTQDLCRGSNSSPCPRSPRARCVMPLGGCDANVCKQPRFFNTNGKAVECFPCQQKARNVSKSGLVGVYVPSCNPDGTYQSVQCHASTGYCWCADPDGTKWPGTSVRGSKTLQCEKRKGPETKSVLVRVVFDMDFGRIKNVKDEFKKSLTQQVAQRFKLNVKQIVDLKVEEGSIKVSFYIKWVEGGRNIANLSEAITEEVRKKDLVVHFGGMIFVAGPEEVVAASQYEKTKEDEKEKGLAPKYIAIIVVISLLIVAAVGFITYKLIQRRRVNGGYRHTVDEHVLYKADDSS